jgi:hypothetical protein
MDPPRFGGGDTPPLSQQTAREGKPKSETLQTISETIETNTKIHEESMEPDVYSAARWDQLSDFSISRPDDERLSLLRETSQDEEDGMSLHAAVSDTDVRELVDVLHQLGIQAHLQ